MPSLEKNRSELVDVEEEISTEVVPFTGVLDVDDYDIERINDVDLDPAYEQAVQAQGPSALERRVAAVAARPILMPVDHAKASAKWWATNVGRGAAWTVTHPHRILPGELRHTGRGLSVMYQGWRYWKNGDVLAEAVKETAATAPGYLAAATKAADARSKRRKISGAVGLVMAGGGTAAWFLEPSLLMAAGGIGMALCNWIGRRNPPDDGSMPIPVARRTALEPGAPLGAIAAQVINRLREEGIRVDPGAAMTVHAGNEYRQLLVHEDAIEAKHLRSLERNLGGRPGAIRIIGTKDAGVSEIRIATGNPLDGRQDASWIPTGSLSAKEFLPLGRSEGEQEFALRFVGVHVALIGRTRSGKSEGGLWTMIDRLSACRDAVIWGIDLQAGPAFPMWRGVIQRTAYSPEDAEALLKAALKLIKDRMAVLNRLAESDDDDEAGSVWTPELGAYLFVFIDEFALTSTYDGQKGRLDLMTPIEEIIRTGLKVGVHLELASQKTGNSDFGSTVISSQIGTKILLACREEDTLRLLSKEHRDQGWSPHMLQPAQGDDPRDAGTCYVEAPTHTTPDRYRFDAWTPGEVKRRARQRMADGLPNLDGTPVGEQEAVVLTPVQLAVEDIFEELADFIANRCNRVFLPTRVLLDELGKRGHQIDPMQLSTELKRAKDKVTWEGKQAQGYVLDDVRKALGIG